VVTGKTCSCYPAVQSELVRAGGKYCPANETYSNACVDGNLVTAPAWPAHPEWIARFLQMLGSRISP